MNGLPVVAAGHQPCDRMIERAAQGERDALQQLIAATRLFVTRLFRAELGATRGVPSADAAADALVPVVVAALLTDRTTAPLRVAYTETVLGIERARPATGPVATVEGFDGLSRHERDVLVLRTVVGLTVEQTAEALASTASRILLDQHAALGVLRRLTAPGAPIHS